MLCAPKLVDLKSYRTLFGKIKNSLFIESTHLEFVSMWALFDIVDMYEFGLEYDLIFSACSW